jgi:hypothetical protein
MIEKIPKILLISKHPAGRVRDAGPLEPLRRQGGGRSRSSEGGAGPMDCVTP